MSSTCAYAAGPAGVSNARSRRSTTARPMETWSDGGRVEVERPRASAEWGVRLTNRGRLVLVLVLLASALALFTFVGSPAASTPDLHHSTNPTIVVQPGQTLWDIAAEAAPGSDPRDVVAAIIDINNLSDPGAIRAGQPLYVPVD